MKKKSNNSGLKYRADHDPRAAALLVLSEVLSTGSDGSDVTGENNRTGGSDGSGWSKAPDSQAALDRRLRESNLMPTDAALCTELVYGVLRLHLRLSWFLRQKLAKPDKLPAEMLLVLELAAYELAHTRIPPHAGVNWAVELLRNRFGQGLAGVGNGVLRAFLRGLDSEYRNPAYYAAKLGLKIETNFEPAVEAGPELESGDKLETATAGFFVSAAFLAVYYAVPEWIAELWLAAYGPEDARRYLEAGISLPPYGLRINAVKPGWKQLLHEFRQEAGAIPVGPAGVALIGRSTRPGQPLKLLLQEGRASRQSAAAYEALWALQPETWATPIWDACAGRGGKSMALLEQGVSVARLSDANTNRLRGFNDDFARLFGEDTVIAMPELVFASAQEASDGKFASILIDAPCSGLGTLAHRPEIRWRRRPEDLERLRETQREILEAARSALLPGGRIIYLTCTLNPAENQDQVSAFLQRHPDFEQEHIWQTASDSPLREFFWGCVLKQQA
ncbi:MAG: 16S rRNA methyltransferase [Deltaproteobacteria bacterium]|jgi:16S rRNA (cytosine967-C5)-methyltransferase|nr:16S rRNA methyltransferase [Deltaproteobacteria bacterium]